MRRDDTRWDTKLDTKWDTRWDTWQGRDSIAGLLSRYTEWNMTQGQGCDGCRVIGLGLAGFHTRWDARWDTR